MSQDDWSGFKVIKKATAPTTAAPAPLPSSPERIAEAQRKAQGAIYAANNEGRQQESQANENLKTQFAAEANARAAEEEKRKKIAATNNGGVDTTASQDQAVGHLIMLTNSMNALKRIGKTNPKATQPGTMETLVSGITDNPTAISWSQHPTLLGMDLGGSDDRQAASVATNTALESAIWLSTGAAAPEDQVKRIKSTIAPNQADGESAKQMKKATMLAYIEQARVRAGPANLKAQQALKDLEDNLDSIYGIKGKTSTTSSANSSDAFHDKEGRPIHTMADIIPEIKTQAAKDFELMSYPAAANQEHADWVRANPNATVADYIQMRKALDSKYGIDNSQQDTDYSDPQAAQRAQDFLDYYRANPNADIPEIHWNRKLGMGEKALNSVTQTDPGLAVANYANAMSAGLPEMLVSQQKRDNFHQRNSESPWWALAGDLVGSINPVNKGSKPLAKVLGKKLVGEDAQRLAGLMAGTVYSGIRGGAAADEGQTMSGTGKGAALGFLGGLAGTAIGGGSRALNSAGTRADLDQLKNVAKMTVLQKMGLGQLEEGIQGLPGVRKARAQSIESFNLDNAQRALDHIDEKLPKGTKPGFDANAAVDKVASDAYNAVRPQVKGSFDQSYQTATQALEQNIRNSGSSLKKDLFKEIKSSLASFRKGSYDGNSFKDADQKLRQLAYDWRRVEAGPGVTSPSTYHEMAGIADKFRQQLRAQVGRNTPEIADRLKALDKTWAHKLRIENATNRSTTGIYSPKQLLTTLKMLDTSKGRGRFARGQALDQDYARAADNILGSAPPTEHSNPMQTLAALYVMMRHPIAVGGPAAALGIPAYTPGLKQLTKVLVSGKRSPEVEQNIRNLVSQTVRQRNTEGQ